MKLLYLITCVFNVVVVAEDSSVWQQRAKDDLNTMLKQKLNVNRAKNVILCIGDGMGVSTVTPARIYMGQNQGKVGEMARFSFEEFPYVGLSKTFSNDRQVTESGAAANAMLAGTKINSGTLGVNTKTVRTDCGSMAGNEVDGIVQWSRKEGKRVGLVTTTRVTHATPAAAYVHSPERKWEADVDVPQADRAKCKDSAYQLIYNNTDINVVMGGGRQNFFPNFTSDREYDTKKGRRTDGLDLTQVWAQDKSKKSSKFAYVWNKKDFDNLRGEKLDYVLGLFEPSHMQYAMDKDTSKDGEPTLAEMAEVAVQVLSQGDKGYFLLLEGGRIDHAHHANKAKYALDETVAFHEAIKKVVEMTDEQDTLIVVTADHSHPFTMGSWTSLNTPILGFVDEVGYNNEPSLDGFPYLSLGYGNGPGILERTNLTGVDVTDKDFAYPTSVPLKEDTHGGEDVAIYARGPMSHLLSGVHENQYIAHVMAYASCVGENKQHCDSKKTEPGECANSGSVMMYSITIMMAAVIQCFVA